jgi:2-polyprenyl-3-methyl-5-hydroxy-6-metoxy-1,4-benzoquinol methylase
MAEAVDTTNYEKFQTGNPVVQRMIGGFYRKVEEVVRPLKPATVLDAGCGEGETLDRLGAVLPPFPVGIDLNQESVEFAAQRLPDATIRQADLLELPFEDSSFDLVLCLEVLEHLPDPAAGLEQLARVSGGDIVVSVPHEPWFRLGSLARGKYLKGWGNHPEHVNHWNPKSFRRFLSTRTEVVEVQTSMPWIIARCRPLPAG